jgi:hypothetical protein
MIKHEYLKVSDLCLATTLALYSPVESTEFVDNKKVLFVFLKTQDLSRLVDLFWRGELREEPQQFFNQLKVIKTRIYSQA